MSNPTIKKRVCDRCGKEFFETYKEWLCKDCMNELGWEYTPKTNADHIRAMSDEDLAEFLRWDICSKVCGDNRMCNGWCDECVIGWLKQPYKEDT